MLRRRPVVAQVAACVAVTISLAACGAGSKTGSEAATKVACDFEKPSEPQTIDVLAYNSSAIDPYTNTMVASCSKNDVTVKHEPIDFGGQVQKTTATLAGDSGTYDIIETYGFVIPELASQDKLQPLDDTFSKYSSDYQLDALSPEMKDAMSYEGKLYALPMQAQMLVLAYRKDIFEKEGLKPPTTFEELRQASKKIQDSGEMKYPLALPWLASGDIVTAYDVTLGSLGENLTDPDTKTANLDSAKSKEAFKELLSLKPYMDPQVTTFDQPAVQQQLYNGSAAMGIMFSGRMADLVNADNTKFSDQFGFAAPPTVKGGKYQYGTLSVDGWSLPTNTKVDPDLLFQVIASSVSEKASKASLPAAYPARKGMVTPDSSPYADAANEAIAHVPPPEPYPWTSRISVEMTPLIANIIVGKTSVDEGTAQMQQVAEKILAEYK